MAFVLCFPLMCGLQFPPFFSYIVRLLFCSVLLYPNQRHQSFSFFSLYFSPIRYLIFHFLYLLVTISCLFLLSNQSQITFRPFFSPRLLLFNSPHIFGIHSFSSFLQGGVFSIRLPPLLLSKQFFLLFFPVSDVFHLFTFIFLKSVRRLHDSLFPISFLFSLFFY